MGAVYAIRGKHQVTIYSQQVRAMQLIWQLARRDALRGKTVAVIGGGIAGVTAAATAVLYGAKVVVVERNEELLHIQRGCHTRYLHPKIFNWPEGGSRSAAAGLPLLNWSVGTADHVANMILSDFFRIKNVAEDLLEVQTLVRDVRISQEGRRVTWRTAAGVRSVDADVVILALGFGVENTINDLPRRSYWRVDSLTQTGLDSDADPYVVVVAGIGDGGILDALRAKLKELDHGSFMDECVYCLESDTLRKKIIAMEAECRNILSRGKEYCARWLRDEYENIPELRAVDDVFKKIRHETHVVWIGAESVPVNHESQPLLRILGWRLFALGLVEYRQGSLRGVRLLDQAGTGGFRYECSVFPDREKTTGREIVHAHQVVVRYGTTSPLQAWFPEVAEVLPEPAPYERITALDEHIREELRALRESLLAREEPSTPVMRAALDEVKDPYRLRVWVENYPKHVQWAEFDLHPESGAIRRRSSYVAVQDSKGKPKQLLRHWINTSADFWIRCRLSDGTEMGAWLSDILEKTAWTSPHGAEAKEKCIEDLREKGPRGVHD